MGFWGWDYRFAVEPGPLLDSLVMALHRGGVEHDLDRRAGVLRVVVREYPASVAFFDAVDEAQPDRSRMKRLPEWYVPISRTAWGHMEWTVATRGDEEEMLAAMARVDRSDLRVRTLFSQSGKAAAELRIAGGEVFAAQVREFLREQDVGEA